MRLANYSICLDVADNTADEDLEQMCRALSCSIRAVMEQIVATYTRGNCALSEVAVTVEE